MIRKVSDISVIIIITIIGSFTQNLHKSSQFWFTRDAVLKVHSLATRLITVVASCSAPSSIYTLLQVSIRAISRTVARIVRPGYFYIIYWASTSRLCLNAVCIKEPVPASQSYSHKTEEEASSELSFLHILSLSRIIGILLIQWLAAQHAPYLHD